MAEISWLGKNRFGARLCKIILALSLKKRNSLGKKNTGSISFEIVSFLLVTWEKFVNAFVDFDS